MKKNKYTLILAFSGLIICIIYTFIFPYEVAYYCSNAVKLCGTSLIPSLFIFMTLSKMLSHLSSFGIFKSSISGLFSRLFCLPECLFPVCIFGLFGGAPSGAFAISTLYEKGMCTKQEAERACVLSNNCSAAFIIGVTGSVFESKVIPVYILISNIVSTFAVYLLFFREKGKLTSNTVHKQDITGGISYIITDSISSAVESIIKLCGYVIFFYTLSGIISQRLTPLLTAICKSEDDIFLIKSVVCSLLELTGGVLSTGNVSGYKAILLCASCVSFTGLSIIFQVQSILGRSSLSSKQFIASRILCAMLSPIITLILLFQSPVIITVSRVTQAKNIGGFTAKDMIFLISITIIAFIGALILSYLDKRHKNK